MRHSSRTDSDIVFDKVIFSNVFNKDIRRVFIYKKAQRLAGALYLVAPAFSESVSLRDQAESVAVALTQAACLPSTRFGEALSRELLALSSVLGVARTAGLLSAMNVDLIARETSSLLADIAAYEEPRLALAEAPNLTMLARRAPRTAHRAPRATGPSAGQGKPGAPERGSARQASILSLIKDKGRVSIKDITLVVRGVSEKTIQRELQGLIDAGQLIKRGERRWSTYSLV